MFDRNEIASLATDVRGNGRGEGLEAGLVVLFADDEGIPRGGDVVDLEGGDLAPSPHFNPRGGRWRARRRNRVGW